MLKTCFFSYKLHLLYRIAFNFLLDDKANQNMKYVAERFIKGFINTKTGIIFVGKNGTGKTHISIAIANELRKQNISIIFGTLTELLEKYSN